MKEERDLELKRRITEWEYNNKNNEKPTKYGINSPEVIKGIKEVDEIIQEKRHLQDLIRLEKEKVLRLIETGDFGQSDLLKKL